MEASRLFRELRDNYVNQQRERIKKSSALYAAYCDAYHEFLIVRDLHVRLAGSFHTVNHDSDFARDELESYKKAMKRAAEYVIFTVLSYDISMVVPCRQNEMLALTKERIQDELLRPVHPALSVFVLFEKPCSRFGNDEVLNLKIYPDVLTNYGDLRKVSAKFKDIFFAYYPKYSVRVTLSNRVYIPFQIEDVGILEGELIYSEAEHAGVFRKELEKSTGLPFVLQFQILKFLFKNLHMCFPRRSGFKRVKVI